MDINRDAKIGVSILEETRGELELRIVLLPRSPCLHHLAPHFCCTYDCTFIPAYFDPCADLQPVSDLMESHPVCQDQPHHVLDHSWRPAQFASPASSACAKTPQTMRVYNFLTLTPLDSYNIWLRIETTADINPKYWGEQMLFPNYFFCNIPSMSFYYQSILKGSDNSKIENRSSSCPEFHCGAHLRRKGTVKKNHSHDGKNIIKAKGRQLVL